MHASRCALAILCLLSSSALAHDADLVSAVVRQGEGGAVDETLTLTAPTLGLLAPLDVDRDGALTQAELDQRREALAAGVWDSVPLFTPQGTCARGETAAAIRDGYVELRARFRCPPGPLRQTFQILSVLPPNYRVVVGRVEGGAAKGERFARGNEQTIDLFDPAPSSARPAAGSGPEGFAGWVALGVGHIFGGIDHLAFLLALLLVSGSWRRVLALVTTFTVAHSITLGATALGFVPLGAAAQRWVEALIALSIVAVAAENLLVKAPRHRVPMVFGFGLRPRVRVRERAAELRPGRLGRGGAARLQPRGRARAGGVRRGGVPARAARARPRRATPLGGARRLAGGPRRRRRLADPADRRLNSPTPVPTFACGE